MESDAWADLAHGIEIGQNDAVERFYQVFNDGFRYRILRALGPDGLDDSVHTCLVTVIMAIRRGGLQEPDRLIGFANTIVKRHIAQQIESRMHERSGRTHVECLDSLAGNHVDAETQAQRAQARDIMLKLFNTMSAKDHEVLRRFYLLGQSEPQICADMRLSPKQFRNLKHRAKQRFVDRWNSTAAPAGHSVRDPGSGQRNESGNGVQVFKRTGAGMAYSGPNRTRFPRRSPVFSSTAGANPAVLHSQQG